MDLNAGVAIGESVWVNNRALQAWEQKVIYELAPELAESRGTTAVQEREILERVAKGIVQDGATTDALKPASPEYAAHIDDLRQLYPQHMAVLESLAAELVAQGYPIPFEYTERDAVRDRDVPVQSVDMSLLVPGAGAIGGAVRGLAGIVIKRVAKRTLEKSAKGAGILKDAAREKGNFGLGSASASEANKLGKAWVGPNHRLSSDGKALISSDGTRQYRFPAYKPNLGKTQANFEKRISGQTTRQWQSNGHLDIE